LNSNFIESKKDGAFEKSWMIDQDHRVRNEETTNHQKQLIGCFPVGR
jgi:hypothetical protein